jgi:hypothetical protein
MKSKVNFPCPKHLCKYDATRFPLLEAVWEELKKKYPGRTRQSIYKKWQERLLPQSIYGGFQIMMPDIQKSPYEYCSVPSNDLETKLERVLNGIYCIEKLKEKYLTMQDAKDAVNKISNGVNTPKELEELKMVFLEYIDKATPILNETMWQFLVKGDFEIIQNGEHSKFTEFQDFGRELLAHIRQQFEKGKIPDLTVFCSFRKFPLVLKLVHLSDRITHALDFNQYLTPAQLIDLLLNITGCVSAFELIKANPTESILMADKASKTKAGKKAQSENNEKHKELWAFYQGEKKECKGTVDYCSVENIANQFYEKNPTIYKNKYSIKTILIRLIKHKRQNIKK